MYSFRNDYSEGAHPKVIKALEHAVFEQNLPYGEDVHSAAAAAMIRELCGREVGVAFLGGGTQTNLLVISSLLRPHQAAIAAATGHINVHETGAVEATGHKILTVPAPDGKLNPELILSVLEAHSGEHMVSPKLVYISDSTELGTIYTKNELSAIRALCLERGLYLFLDGARLGSALKAPENDLTIADLASLTDVFYIGGTKNAALFGEALVMVSDDIKEDFRYLIKQRGAMTAKGFVLGLQFEALLDGGLWLELAEHENAAAAKIAASVSAAGYEFYARPQSNQLFIIMPASVSDALMEPFPHNVEKLLPDGQVVARLVTSWSIPESAVEAVSCWFSAHPLPA